MGGCRCKGDGGFRFVRGWGELGSVVVGGVVGFGFGLSG